MDAERQRYCYVIHRDCGSFGEEAREGEGGDETRTRRDTAALLLVAVGCFAAGELVIEREKGTELRRGRDEVTRTAVCLERKSEKERARERET